MMLLQLALALPSCLQLASSSSPPPPSAPPAAAFEWIRAIESGPAGRRYELDAGTHLIDRQYQLPPRTEIVGAGSDHGGGAGDMTVIKGVGVAYNSTCGANAKNRKGLLLGDHTYVARLHFIGTDTARYRLDPPDNDLCGGAPIETPGCAGGNGYTTSPVDCGGDTGIGRGVTNATVEDVSVAPFTYQVAFFASPTKAGVSVTTGLTIRNYRSGGTFADGINIHGAHRDVLVEDCDIALTGDDCFAIWSIGALADNISFVNNHCSHRCGRCPAAGQHGAEVCREVCNHLLPSGMVRGFGCYAAYGGKASAFINNTGEDCSTQGNNAMVTFGYGNAGHPTMPTCFGGVFSNASSTTMIGNIGGNQSRTKSVCVFYERRCPFPRGSPAPCAKCYNSTVCNFTEADDNDSRLSS